jgi:cell division septation protein DedD
LVLAAEEPQQFDWALTAAIEIARKLAEQGKVVLVDAGAGGALLAEKLRVGHEGGIVDVLFRGASFSAMARRPVTEKFFFLPLGVSAARHEVLFQHPRWLKIAERLTDADAHLLTCVSAADWVVSGPISGFESCIILNGSGHDVELPAGARRVAEFLAPPKIREAATVGQQEGPAGDGLDEVETGAPELQEEGRVEPASESSDAAALVDSPAVTAKSERAPVVLGVSEPEDASRPSAYWDSLGRWRGRARLAGLGPLGRRITAAAAVVAAVVTVAVLWAVLRTGGAPDEASVFQAVAETTAVPAPVTPPPANDDRPGGRPRGVGLPYSVAIASYSSFEDALARQKRLARNEMPVYVAPTPVRGVVYYRVFAGLLAERSEAEALMAQLVREGIKDTVRAWDVRQAQFAFSFGTFDSAREAGKKLEELIQLGIHAYRVPVGAGTAESAVAYHVYAGGYETREAAAPLREQIETAGLSAELVERVGLQER